MTAIESWASWPGSTELKQPVHDPTATRLSAPQDSEALAGFLGWCEHAKRMSPNTLKSYRSVMRQWADWVPAGELLTADRNAVSQFLQRPRKKRGNGESGAARTVRRDRSVLNSFYQWAVAEGLAARNPVTNVAAPKIVRAEPKPIPFDVWQKAFSRDMSPLERVTLGLGYYCGLRRAEMVALRGEHLTQDRGWIRGFVRKGGGDHSIPWLDMVSTAQRKLVGHQTRWVDLFCDELHDLSVQMGPHPLLSPWSQSLHEGVVNRKLADYPFTPHQLRHSCATNLVKAGVPIEIVQQLLNHGSITVTMGYVAVATSELGDWLGS